jgi:hypothetical protein
LQCEQTVSMRKLPLTAPEFKVDALSVPGNLMLVWTLRLGSGWLRCFPLLFGRLRLALLLLGPACLGSLLRNFTAPSRRQRIRPGSPSD